MAAWVAGLVSLNNRPNNASLCCCTKILWLELWLKFKVCGREIGCTRETLQSGVKGSYEKSPESGEKTTRKVYASCILWLQMKQVLSLGSLMDDSFRKASLEKGKGRLDH